MFCRGWRKEKKHVKSYDIFCRLIMPVNMSVLLQAVCISGIWSGTKKAALVFWGECVVVAGVWNF